VQGAEGRGGSGRVEQPADDARAHRLGQRLGRAPGIDLELRQRRHLQPARTLAQRVADHGRRQRCRQQHEADQSTLDHLRGPGERDTGRGGPARLRG
jgi:hypothetical protein